jgi:hypothetical protein
LLFEVCFREKIKILLEDVVKKMLQERRKRIRSKETDGETLSPVLSATYRLEGYMEIHSQDKGRKKTKKATGFKGDVRPE